MSNKENKNPKFLYAYNEFDDLVCINDSQLVGSKFTCPNPKCRGEMIARRGEINAYHFAHKSAECKYDHYLHTIAELLIKEWYNKSDNINISIPYKAKCSQIDSCKFSSAYSRCVIEKNTKPINLKKWYEKCEREQECIINDHKFVPDLLLKKDDDDFKDCIFIEVYVTHPCEIEKLDSKINIIEIKIDSEDDLKTLFQREVLESDYTVRFHNFTIKNPVVSQSEFNYCAVQKITVLPSGIVRQSFNCSSIDILNSNGGFELIVSKDDYNSATKQSFYDVAVAVASQYVGGLRNCALCRYRGAKEYNFRICNYRSKEGKMVACDNRFAPTCPGYSIDESAVSKRRLFFENYKKQHPVIMRLNGKSI